MPNTGYKIYTTLKKVSDDGNNTPLDINNVPISISGLPQAIKDNLISDPDYKPKVYDITTCPLPVCDAPVLTSLTPSGANLNINFTTTPGCTALTVQTSTNGGLSWGNSTSGCSSPRQIPLPTVSTKIRLVRECLGGSSLPSNELTFTPIFIPSCPLGFGLINVNNGINGTNCEDIRYSVRLIDNNGIEIINTTGGDILINCTATYSVGDCASPISSFEVIGDLIISNGQSRSYNFFGSTSNDNIVSFFSLNSVSPTTMSGCSIKALIYNI